jgi:hypothetical protein
MRPYTDTPADAVLIPKQRIKYDCYQYDEDILTAVQDSDDSDNTFDYEADSDDILQVEEGEGRGCPLSPFTQERENRSETLF